jgi:cephalosporin hydroxylase
MNNKEITNAFHQQYYYSGVWANDTKWMGVSVQKCPLDLWIYQELIFELRPDLIIETGTCFGGSALFMAQVCDLIGYGNVITIDIKEVKDKYHQRVQYLKGSSIDKSTIDVVADRVNKHSVDVMAGRFGKPPVVMVVLDSDHSRDYVIKEMECYAPFVTKGSYLIVEDSDVNGHPICPDHGPGPAEAITDFIKTHPEFEVDLSREKFMMTQNPGGYLRRR